MTRYWRSVSIVCTIVLAAASGSGAAEYETPRNRTARDVLPPTVAAGPDYAVSDPVVADGYMYHYKFKSPYATFDVTGTGALRKLEHEIWAIGQLKKVTKSEAFLKSLKDQAGKPLIFAKDVITKPGETLSGIPKGVGRRHDLASTRGRRPGILMDVHPGLLLCGDGWSATTTVAEMARMDNLLAVQT